MSHLDAPVAVVGLGLIGGSIARGLVAARPELRILAVDPDDASRRIAREGGWVHVAEPTLADLRLDDCALVIIAAPMAALDSIIRALDGKLPPHAVVTDTIGVKCPVLEALRAAFPDQPLAGGHPMAGGEGGKTAAARPDLFEGAPVAICPEPATPEASSIVTDLWRTLGANPVQLDAETHDFILAATSHAPYAAAVAQLDLLGGVDTQGLVGRGLLGATRYGAFEPDVMAEVALQNPGVPGRLRALARKLERVAELVETDPEGFRRLAERARETRRQLEAARAIRPYDSPSGS